MKKIIKNIISLSNLPINGSWQIVEEEKSKQNRKDITRVVFAITVYNYCSEAVLADY